MTKLLLKQFPVSTFFTLRRAGRGTRFRTNIEHKMSLENKTFLCGGKAKVYKVYKCSLAVFLVVMFVYGFVYQQHHPKRGQEDYWYTGTGLMRNE